MENSGTFFPFDLVSVVRTVTVWHSNSSDRSSQFWTRSQRCQLGMQTPSSQVNSSSEQVDRVRLSQVGVNRSQLGSVTSQACRPTG